MYRKEICGFLYFNGFPFTNNLNFRAKNCNFFVPTLILCAVYDATFDMLGKLIALTRF